MYRTLRVHLAPLCNGFLLGLFVVLISRSGAGVFDAPQIGPVASSSAGPDLLAGGDLGEPLEEELLVVAGPHGGLSHTKLGSPPRASMTLPRLPQQGLLGAKAP